MQDQPTTWPHHDIRFMLLIYKFWTILDQNWVSPKLSFWLALYNIWSSCKFWSQKWYAPVIYTMMLQLTLFLIFVSLILFCFAACTCESSVWQHGRSAGRVGLPQGGHSDGFGAEYWWAGGMVALLAQRTPGDCSGESAQASGRHLWHSQPSTSGE